MEFTDFNKVKVEEPNFEELKNKFVEFTTALKKAKDSKQAIKVVYNEFKFEDEFSSNYIITSIRNSINIKDEYYDKLIEQYNMNMPILSEYSNNFQLELVNSKFRKELEEEFGTHLFNQIDISLKIFSPEIIPDLQEENKLTNEYDKLVGTASAMFNGEELPITKFTPYLTSLDREVRKQANKAFWSYYEKNDEKLGQIYDQLVKVRTRIAKKLGFDNFIQVAYYRLGRTDYNQEDVANYRNEILKNIVPIAKKLYKKQASRIGIDDMKYYDFALSFKTGNPKPIGTPNQLVEKASKMYNQMNKQIAHYFDFMVSHNCMDLEAKSGKVPGGYMTYIPSLNTSFIFSNFNGSSGDVDVLTHEFGHSLQGFLSGDIKVPSLRSPGYEACEIHSMSMEFLTYPWMDLFFEENKDKYCFAHLEDAIEFIPYGVSVDEFQHYVYENPDATHAQRKAKWREIEKKYTPHKNYGEDNPYLESGAFWIKQSHIFSSPFYYIDYTIAQVGAFEFFVESLNDYDKTIEKYLNFCKLGGLYPYKELLAKAGIKNPMVSGTIEQITPKLEAYLDSFDTSKF